MKTEKITKIILNSQKELYLILASNGHPMYQYVYREAAGVYWDNIQKGFKSNPMIEWTVSDWYFHIKDIVRSGLNVHLTLDEALVWENIPDSEKEKIKNGLTRG
jgi:hypothetical protein